jgi:sigma-54 dependent transcriptional regulator, acetoin dehydrogenase operon transcriptional activator AcoR
MGSGPLWLRSCGQVEAACASGEWLSLEGEPGTGKLALLRAVCRRRSPAGAFHVLDAADAGDHDWMARAPGDLLAGEGTLVIRHADRLSTVRLQALWIALEQTLPAGRQQVLWVAVTLSQGPPAGDLAGLNPHGPLACSPGAMHLLLRSTWPGNTEQLWQVLRRVARHRRTGTIHPG